MKNMISVDIELSRKLERTEGRANADFVETRARLEPESGAGWIEVGGAYGMFDGVESPLTQSFGLGIFEAATDEHFDRLESFFRERGAPVFHEISPLADLSLLGTLSGRGYVPVELSTIMFQELSERTWPEPQEDSAVTARLIERDEAKMWAATVADGWAPEQPELFEFLRSLGEVTAQTSGGRPFIAEMDGKPVGAGGFLIYDDVCILAGASTIPSARQMGAQNALLNARLSFAAEQGCKLAMMGAAPGSQSQKNAQRNGFNIAYTRIKWQLNR